MRSAIRTLVFVIIVLVFFGQAIFPPETSLRLGKDLQGGATLVYELDIAPGEDPKAVVQRTIEVLKQRIDPDGLFEIAIVSQGNNRIEITMPLPNARVKALRKAYDDAVSELTANSVDETEVHELLLAGAEDRVRRLDRIAPSGELRTRLETLVSLNDQYWETERALRVLSQDPAATPEAKAQLVDQGTTLLRQLAETESAVLGQAPSEDEVRQAMSRSQQTVGLWDDAANRRIEIESPRVRAIQALKDRFPAAAAKIDAVVDSYNEYEEHRKSLDDPSDLIRLIKASGILTFRITVDAQGDGTHPDVQELRERLREFGPRRASTRDARWFKINKIESWYNNVRGFRAIFGDPEAGIPGDPAAYFASYGGGGGFVVEEFRDEPGTLWMLCWDQPGYRLTHSDDGVGSWAVAAAFPGVDQQGRPAISFRMDANGSILLGRLTGDHTGRPMAVMLDDEVYTAPNLNSRITSSGIIEGSFSSEEIDYIVRVMSAGSLQAKLSPEPISQSTVGPELGRENLIKGFRAGVVAIVCISAFLIIYYFKCGVIAVIALFCNAILLIGAMALNQAAFTMPGIAGIILAFGMAVDSNVLIYERIREELQKGAPLKEAVRLGFARALSAIVDGNITNLIVCVVLVLPGVATQEVKGFAITLGIGVLTTLFSALVISRVIFELALQYGGWRKTSMLPMAVPAVQRLFTVNVNWMRLRWVFVGISAVYVGLGLYFVGFQGSEMLDTEFRGGTKVILKFSDEGQARVMARQDVVDRLNAIAAEAQQDDDDTNDAAIDLRVADVLAVEPFADADGNVVSDRYSIKTTITDSDLVQRVLKEAFADVLDTKPPITPANGLEASRHVYPVINGDLASNFPNATFPAGQVSVDVESFLDGVAILIEDMQPAPTLEDLVQRIEQVRQAEYPHSLSRTRTIEPIVMEGDLVRTAAVVVRDTRASYSDPNQGQEWDALAAEEFGLVSAAISRSSSLSGVEKFSSSMAETFRNRAVVAVFLSTLLILIYIWIRFGNLRYSTAAVVVLIHNVLAVLGILAIAEVLHDWGPTQGVARSLGLMPFRIDLNMVAALLTIMGYDINDTIVVFDRIREVKGRAKHASKRIINDAINQTLSRTIITGGTTLFAALALYVLGGEGVRALAFALFVGVVVGTYGSIAIAAPLAWSPKHEEEEQELLRATGKPTGGDA